MISNVEDCIHLQACRRLVRMFKARYPGLNFGRQCNAECEAYVSGGLQPGLITAKNAMQVLRNREKDEITEDEFKQFSWTLAELIHLAKGEGGVCVLNQRQRG